MIGETITQRWRRFIETQTNIHHFHEKHGKQVIQTIILNDQSFDALLILPQEVLKICRTKKFYELLAWNLSKKVHSIRTVSCSDLKAFVSWVYQQEGELFTSMLLEIINAECLSMFISGEYKDSKDQEIMMMQEQNSVLSDSQIQHLNSTITTTTSSTNNNNSSQQLNNNESPELLLWHENFHQQEAIASEIEDAISEILNIKNRNALLSFETQVKLNSGNTYVFVYRSESLGISDVCSNPKSRKKEAQHEAAKRFLPYFMYFAKYKQPFFNNLEEANDYFTKNKGKFSSTTLRDTQNKAQQSTSCSSSSNSGSRDQSMEKDVKSGYDLRADLEMNEAYNQEIVDVYKKIQQHEEKNGVDNLKVEFKSLPAGVFSCVLQFIQQGQVVFSTEGRGVSKKASKEVAFMKLNGLMREFYEKKQEIERKSRNQEEDERKIRSDLLDNKRNQYQMQRQYQEGLFKKGYFVDYHRVNRQYNRNYQQEINNSFSQGSQNTLIRINNNGYTRGGQDNIHNNSNMKYYINNERNQNINAVSYSSHQKINNNPINNNNTISSIDNKGKDNSCKINSKNKRVQIKQKQDIKYIEKQPIISGQEQQEQNQNNRIVGQQISHEERNGVNQREYYNDNRNNTININNISDIGYKNNQSFCFQQIDLATAWNSNQYSGGIQSQMQFYPIQYSQQQQQY